MIVNGGMRERVVGKVIDPLHARCLVLDDGTTQLAIVVVDSCMIPRALLDDAKRQARAATGIPASRMLISATHTHEAPSVCAILGSGQEDEYAKFLAGKIAQGIAAAQKNLAPARIGWAKDKDPRNVFCRRYLMKPGTARTCRFTGHENDRAQMNPGYQNPNSIGRTGPADTDVSVISIQSPDGRPIALLGNYSTHYAGGPSLSADYFGVFCKLMKERLASKAAGPPFVALMTNGTSGDANCCDFDNPREKSKHDRFSVAQGVADAATRALAKIKYHSWVPLAMAEELLTLGVRMPTAAEVTEAKEYIAANMKDHDKPRNTTEVYAWETVFLSQLPSTREIKLQAIRIGELGITTIPCEVYGSTGLTIKKESPLPTTFTVELANGAEGYIPPPEQHKLGGYNTWRARSSCLEEQGRAQDSRRADEVARQGGEAEASVAKRYLFIHATCDVPFSGLRRPVSGLRLPAGSTDSSALGVPLGTRGVKCDASCCKRRLSQAAYFIHATCASRLLACESRLLACASRLSACASRLSACASRLSACASRFFGLRVFGFSACEFSATDLRVPVSDLRPPVSTFRFPLSGFRLPAPDLRFPLSLSARTSACVSTRKSPGASLPSRTGADRNPHQAEHFVVEFGEHSANLAILALAQHDFQYRAFSCRCS